MGSLNQTMFFSLKIAATGQGDSMIFNIFLKASSSLIFKLSILIINDVDTLSNL